MKVKSDLLPFILSQDVGEKDDLKIIEEEFLGNRSEHFEERIF